MPVPAAFGSFGVRVLPEPPDVGAPGRKLVAESDDEQLVRQPVSAASANMIRVARGMGNLRTSSHVGAAEFFCRLHDRADRYDVARHESRESSTALACRSLTCRRI